jgi:hypothetical protein
MSQWTILPTSEKKNNIVVHISNKNIIFYMLFQYVLFFKKQQQ